MKPTHAHIFQQGHFDIKCGPDDIVWLLPKTVREIGTNREVIPVHTIDHKVFTINYQFDSVIAVVDLDIVRLGRSREDGKE